MITEGGSETVPRQALVRERLEFGCVVRPGEWKAVSNFGYGFFSPSRHPLANSKRTWAQIKEEGYQKDRARRLNYRGARWYNYVLYRIGLKLAAL